MKNKRIRKGKAKKSPLNVGESLDFHGDLQALYGKLNELMEFAESTEERLQDLEIHVNLLTRLLTTLCVEKFGMRIGVLKRLIKRIEKEAIRDSQIMHLESLYKLPVRPDGENKSKTPHPKGKSDPWEEIS